jgi:hypothetical protein
VALDISGVSLYGLDGALVVDKAAVNWLRVNGGGVVQRRVPFFRAQLSGQGNLYRASVVKPALVTNNVGNCWNAATGLFTCPVAGKYLVYMGGIAAGNLVAAANGATTNWGYFAIMKNGVPYVRSHWNHGSNYDAVSLSAPVDCAAGDTIGFLIADLPIMTPSGNGWYGLGSHGNFFIVLAR